MKTSVHQTTILCDNRNKDQDIFLIIDQIDTLYHLDVEVPKRTMHFTS